MMKPNSKGFYDEKTVLESGLPIVDFAKDLDCYCEVAWFTYTDLKKILEINLTEDERENCIAAFEKMRNGQGYVALYNYMHVLSRRAEKRN